MRVAFLNPMFGTDFTKSARWFARSRGRVQRHPDYFCIAAGVVEAAGHEIFFLDAQAKNMPTPAALEKLKTFKPDMVVYQASTPSIDADIESARLCKEGLGGLHVMIGPHVTAEPEDTLNRADGAVDAVAIAEYDYTLRDLANGVPLRDCQGIAWMDGGAFVRNADRPYIENLDELAFPAWKHIDIYDYHDFGKLFPFLTLISGRGCRAKCTFCQLPQVMNGHQYRVRSVENVVDEIEYDIKLFPNLKEIMFEDDTLTMRSSQDRLVELCEAMIRRKVGISWSANARVDVNDLEVLKLMKRSGCRWLCVGFEFGDQQVLNNVKKGATIAQMHRFAQNAAKAGIRVHGCFMFGGPGETEETAQKTLDLSKRLPIDTAQFTAVVAYPGTAYYNWAKQNGYLKQTAWRDWVDENFEQRSTQELPGLTVEQINAFIDRGLRDFYLRPSQMWRMLRNIQNVPDLRAKLHGVKSFVSYFRNKERAFTGFVGNN
ncbi:MAG: radical SAM protein [Candidatus Hydrogenedentes bacterium]|nr:radical SAM protein [Candidatus Hydrogenedentota bacterium]